MARTQFPNSLPTTVVWAHPAVEEALTFDS